MKTSLLLFSLLLVSCATAPPRHPPQLDGIRQKLQVAVAEGKLASISIAVAVDGEIIWNEAFGWADRERRIRATPTTRYPIASTTKPMTATAVMVLADRGLIDIGRPANDYLGAAKIRGFSDDASKVTVRMLMQHFGGLAEHNEFYFSDDPRKRPPVDDAIGRYALVTFPVGDRYRYSNLGYGVLESIIEHTSERSFTDFMQSEVFEPLRMTRTTVGPGTSDTATLYDDERRPIPSYVLSSHGSGSVVSTPTDIVRFALFHSGTPIRDQRSILRDASRRRMLEERRSTGSATGRYGLDWYCGLGICGRDTTPFGVAWYGHDGGMPGALARWKTLPSRGVVVAAVSNSRDGMTHEIVDEILAIYSGDDLEKRKLDPSLASSPVAPQTLPAELTATWRGEIVAHEETLSAVLVIDGNDMKLQIGNGSSRPVKNVRLDGTMLRGEAEGPLPIGGIPPYPYDLQLRLEWHGDELAGALYAASPPPLFHFWLPTRIRLQRDGPKPVPTSTTSR